MKTEVYYCDVCGKEVLKAEKRRVAGSEMMLCPYHIRRFFAFHPFIYIDGWTERNEEALGEIFGELNDNVVVLTCRSTPLDEAFPEEYSAMLSALRHASNALYGDRTERRGMIYIVLDSPLTASAWHGSALPDLSRNFVRPAVWVNSLDYSVRIGEAVLGIRKFINMQKNAFPPTQVFQFRGKPSSKTMLNMAWNLWRKQHEVYLLRKAEVG